MPGNKQHNFVVAIGASAGGLEAIHDFFDNVPQNNNLSFIIIQHLSPDYKSLLVELVAKHTQMKVFEAGDGQVLEKNCVYVIPNKKIMTLSKGKLCLVDKSQEKTPNTTIDTFLFSLAKDKAEKAIAIILSGTGTDGTRGAQAIKDAGGMIMVQDPATAKFDGMPNSAIAAGFADYILPPELMPGEIDHYIQEPPLPVNERISLDNRQLEQILQLVYKYAGNDFSSYKDATLVRRIARRMLQTDYKNAADYIHTLTNNPQECKLLAKDFLIGVTQFFRDKAAFEALTEDIFPAITANKMADDIVKIWVAACSTGEEAYTIAMLLTRYLKKTGKHLQVKIFATDVDEKAIEQASSALYTAAVVKDIPTDYLEEFFTQQGKSYQVRTEIRKMIVFAKHNIIKDPPFIKNDLVTCRNMLIYMNAALQKKVLASIHFSLNPGGFLFLGPSETVSVLQENLEEVNRKWKLYRKGTANKPVSPLLLTGQPEYNRTVTRPRQPLPFIQRSPEASNSLQKELCTAITEDIGYAALYVDANYVVREAMGNFKKYLSLPDRSLNLNVLKMVVPDLSIALNTAMRKSFKEGKKVILERIRIREENRVRYISILVKPASPVSANPYTLIVLGEQEVETPVAAAHLSNGQQGVIKEIPEADHLLELQAELKETKDNLQAAVESLETSNEELQSSNEELLSANEELQSSNEELQSLNEELHTLNTEHQARIAELVELNDDLNNYFRSTDIGQIFLDGQLCIRKFNLAAVKLVNLIETDIGRPISHISNNLLYDNLLNDIEAVIRTRQVIDHEIEIAGGQTTLMRIFPYVRQDKQINGAIITFIDITAVKELNNILRGVFNASPNAILALKAVRNGDQRIHDFKIIAANDPAAHMFDRQTTELTDRSFKNQLPALADPVIFNKLIKLVQDDQPVQMEYNYTSGNTDRWLEIVAVKMGDGLAATVTDITSKKTAEERLRKNYNELMKARNDLRELNAGLENKVKERTFELMASEERFRLVSEVTNDAIWDWNLVTNELWVSDNFFNIFGYPGGNNTFKRDLWLEKIHPDDRSLVNETIHKNINNNKKHWSCEYRFQKANGDYAYILDRGSIMHDDYGVPYRVLSSMFDVTNLRKAEQEVLSSVEQTRFLAEAMPLLVWTALPGGEVDFLNSQFEKLTGISLAEGKEYGWKKVIHPESLNLLRKLGQQALEAQEDFSIEVMIRSSDGEYRWHLLRARAKKDENGKLVMWVGTNTDIHEQKTATQVMEKRVRERTLELQQANKELAASNDELQQFASVASHDLKEPLRKIHMFSNMLKDKYAKDRNDAALQYLERILNSSNRMIQLVNDLLNFSRLSATLVFEPVNLNVIVNEVLSDLELTIQEKQAVIDIANLPTLQLAPGQIRQVFQNILSNALKFSRPGVPPVIKVTAALIREKNFESPADTRGHYCRISINDNGIGFDEQYLEKIFTIFQRLHTRQAYEGTGIGLAICKKIIEKHNGLITASSKENEGATFIIILPLQQA